MSLEEFFSRLRARIFHFLNSENRSTRIFSRFVALVCAGFIVATIAPTIADELSASPESIETTPAPQPVASGEPTATPEVTPTGEATSSPSPSAEPEIIRPSIAVSSPTPAVESSDSATVVEEPPGPLAEQPQYTLRIPTSQAVDPRAKSYLLPHIYAQTADPSVITLACISGSRVSFDALQKKSQQTDLEGPDLIVGDRSGQVLIAGPSARVMNLINSYGGLVLFSDSSAIAGRSAFFQFVALNKPSLDPSFCAASRANAVLSLRALSLAQSTVKGGGTLK